MILWTTLVAIKWYLIKSKVWLPRAYRYLKKTIKMALQKSLLWHLGKDYSALVLAIKMMWKDKITNLSDIIFWVTHYAKINKENKKNNILNTKVLATNIYRVLKRTYTTKEYMEQDITTYYINCCWILHSKLHVKYFFYQMHLRRLNKNVKKTANIPNSSTNNVTSRENIPEIVS